MKALLRLLGLTFALLLVARPVSAEPEDDWDPGAVRADLEAGRPLVVHVTVALCSNDQIDCGSKIAGRPGNLSHNIYWGAIFGARRFLERKRSEFSRIELRAVDDRVLERAVYRRIIPGKRWKLSRSGSVEQIVVLDAVHGDRIDDAVKGFWSAATRGSKLTIRDGEASREVRVHVAGYVGHNRLMDGLKLPSAAERASKQRTASFVLACYSEQYFGDRLREAGSKPLVMTRQLMAPEGYVLDAVLRGVGDGAPTKEIRRRAVAAYSSFSKLSLGTASTIFAR